MPGDSGSRPQLNPPPSSDPASPTLTVHGDFWFRLFSHATLALAGVCLVHGEAYYLPLLPWCLLPYLALLVAAFRAERRWVLPEAWANALAVLIVFGLYLWVRYQPGGPGVLKGQEVWVRLVPFIGPFLMALLTVQLFRPRGPNHFWYLQGMGLIQVALGCVLASSPLFGLLMSVYLTCALGCLALHYLSAPGTVGRPPSWRWLLGFVARFSLVVAASALAVFLITPRSQSAVWDPLQRFGNRAPAPSRWPPPGGPFQGANLNGTLPVELSTSEAFTLRATDARGPKLDLSLETRFRTMVLETYQDGIWLCDGPVNSYRGMVKQLPWDKDKLPDFGPDQYYLHFDVGIKAAGALVWAEPVRLGAGEHRYPVVLTDFSHPHAPLFFIQGHSGTLLPIPTLEWPRYRYKQVVARVNNPDRSPAEFSLGGMQYISELTRQSLPNLDRWTAKLLRRLASDSRYHLPTAALVPDPRWPDRADSVPPEYYERVAVALCKYLTESGDYTYSLEQRRKDLNLDPVEDFLFNIKEGHCERYASALALMLRTQGVPTRMIKGYRGVDQLGGGAYRVTQNMAHAWVEVLVRRPAGDPGSPYEWLTLDPTPGIESARQPSVVAGWWKEKSSAGANMWQRLIVGYNAENQADVLSRIAPSSVLTVITWESLKWIAAPFLALCFVVVYVVVRLRWSMRGAPREAAGSACYARLVRILSRRGRLRRSPGQTPRELAAAASNALTARAATAALADVPHRVVDLFYRVRYGGESPVAGEIDRLNVRIDELRAALIRTGPLFSGGAG